MNNLYNVIKTKTNKSISDAGNFSHRATETTVNINANATLAEDEYVRCMTSLKETLHVIYCLHSFDGVIKTEVYNEQVQCLKDMMIELRKRLEIESVSLVEVEHGKIVAVIPFDDQYACDLYCTNKYGCSSKDLIDPMKYDKKYHGSVVKPTMYNLQVERVLDIFKIGT